jgi:hypothetical protein
MTTARYSVKIGIQNLLRQMYPEGRTSSPPPFYGFDQWWFCRLEGRMGLTWSSPNYLAGSLSLSWMSNPKFYGLSDWPFGIPHWRTSWCESLFARCNLRPIVSSCDCVTGGEKMTPSRKCLSMVQSLEVETRPKRCRNFCGCRGEIPNTAPNQRDVRRLYGIVVINDGVPQMLRSRREVQVLHVVPGGANMLWREKHQFTWNRTHICNQFATRLKELDKPSRSTGVDNASIDGKRSAEHLDALTFSIASDVIFRVIRAVCHQVGCSSCQEVVRKPDMGRSLLSATYGALIGSIWCVSSMTAKSKTVLNTDQWRPPFRLRYALKKKPCPMSKRPWNWYRWCNQWIAPRQKSDLAASPEWRGVLARLFSLYFQITSVSFTDTNRSFHPSWRSWGRCQPESSKGRERRYQVRTVLAELVYYSNLQAAMDWMSKGWSEILKFGRLTPTRRSKEVWSRFGSHEKLGWVWSWAWTWTCSKSIEVVEDQRSSRRSVSSATALASISEQESTIIVAYKFWYWLRSRMVWQWVLALAAAVDTGLVTIGASGAWHIRLGYGKIMHGSDGTDWQGLREASVGGKVHRRHVVW